MQPHTSSKLKVNNIKIGRVETYPNGLCKFLKLNYDNYPLCILTPKLKGIWGIRTNWSNDQKTIQNYTLALYLDDEKESGIKLEKFKDKIESIDKRILKKSLKKSYEWFNRKNISEEELDILYYKSVKYKNNQSGEIDRTYPCYLQSKLNKTGWILRDKTGKIIENVNQDNINMYLMQNCVLKAILIPKVWVNMDNNFGISYVVKEFIIYDIGDIKDYNKKEKPKKPNKITKYLKINDDDNDDNNDNDDDDNDDNDDDNDNKKKNVVEDESSDEYSDDYSD